MIQMINNYTALILCNLTGWETKCPNYQIFMSKLN
jgi:hypothetical protein